MKTLKICNAMEMEYFLRYLFLSENQKPKMKKNIQGVRGVDLGQLSPVFPFSFSSLEDLVRWEDGGFPHFFGEDIFLDFRSKKAKFV